MAWVAFHKASINIQKLLIFNIDWKVKVCKYLSFTVLSDSGNVGAKNIQFLAECFGTEKMWFKVKWSPVEITTSTVMPSVMTTDNERASKTLHTKITDLPDDVLLIILLRLEPRDMIRWVLFNQGFKSRSWIFSVTWLLCLLLLWRQWTNQLMYIMHLVGWSQCVCRQSMMELKIFSCEK